MKRSNNSSWIAICRWLVVSLISLSFAGCGQDSAEDSIFLYIINGYAGAAEISLYGPSGTIVQGLKFGERNGPSPIEIDRKRGTDYTLVVDGLPEPIDLQKEVFALYPQETATLFLKRRSGDTDVNTALFRHVQTIDPNCAITFSNSLNLDNDFLTVGEFSYAAEFNITDPNRHGYFDESTIPVVTECGPLPVPTPAPIPRPEILQAVTDDPWFFLTRCPNEQGGENFVCFQWGSLMENGIVAGPAATPEYMECVSGAVEVRQDEMTGGLIPGAGEVQCPEGELTYDDVQIDTVTLRECKRIKQYSVDMVQPGTDEAAVSYLFLTDEVDGKVCTETFRIRTPLFDIIFGPEEGSSTPGKHQKGGFVESTVTIPRGSEHFWVLFGRPVNPLVWQWDSGETTAKLSAFPYPNEQDTRIGEYDD